jgi:nitrogen fixation NifU-like protein
MEKKISMLNSSGHTLAMKDDFFGRMNDPSAGAWVTGPCGDTMEFYLIIEDDIIRQAKYHTDGCGFTRLCGHTVAAYVQGKSIVEALSVSGKQILAALPQLPPEHRHCAILAVSTFYMAIGKYWVKLASP